MFEPIARSASQIRRRQALPLVLSGALLLGLAGGCHKSGHWHSTDVTGTYPPLELTMTRAATGKQVTEAAFHGHVVMLYFGYSKCQTVCPITMANVSRVLQRLGPVAKHVRVLFVTVDPQRDTPAVLAKYVQNFGSEVVGLRGDRDQLTKLARRYRVAFSSAPKNSGKPYIVTHSSAIYVFDGSGNSRLLVSSLSSSHPDLDGVVADLKRIVKQSS